MSLDDLNARFARLGFTDAIEKEQKDRVIASISGPHKTGKTRLALTAPKPIVLLNLDRGVEHLTDEMEICPGELFEKKVCMPRIQAEFNLDKKTATDLSKERDELQDSAREIWSEFSSTYKTVLSNPDVRSVIVDSETQLWQLMRIAQFGRESAKAIHYGPVNAMYLRLFKLAEASDKTVLFTRRHGDLYEGDKRAAGYSVKGMKEVAFEVELNIETWRRGDNGDEYFAKIMSSGKRGGDFNGMELTGDELSIEWLIEELK